MANSFSAKGKVHVIDTAAVINTQHARVRHIRWVGGTTAGHQAIIENADGEVIWESVASGANFVESELALDADWPGGFEVATLDSGKLYITLK